MALKLRNKRELNKYFAKQAEVIEQALIFNLEALVANLENHAKLSAGYKDQTSNLKSSIGGVILKDGKPIKYQGFTGKGEGIKEGKAFINSLITDYSNGYVLILVAGMEYATYVENFHGLNVLKKTELKMQVDLRKTLNKLKKKLGK